MQKNKYEHTISIIMENYQEKKTNEFINKIETILKAINMQCDYEIIEHDDGTRYAKFTNMECFKKIMDVHKNYALDVEIADDGYYLVDVPP